MLIVYDSLTGNVKRFVNKLKYNEVVKLGKDLKVSEPYYLITYTIGFGEVPETTKEFLKNNHRYLKGVATSGNRIWGDNYGKAGESISKMYSVPLLLKFELSGTEEDIKQFEREVI